MTMTHNTMTVPEAAERLGVTPRRVLALIHAGRLPAKQYGRDWIIREDDLDIVTERKPGRPPKTQQAKQVLPNLREKK